MFSKNTYFVNQQQPDSSTNPLQYSHASTSMNEILLSHHHDMLSSHYLHTNPPPVAEPPVLYNPDGDPSAQRTAKKDRHSKIYTSLGPRDRRVRLSIGVARKFFDLQEILGFDKPSKTLDWLLTKSRAAIKHLVSTKQPADGSKSTVISSLSECEDNYRNDECPNSARKKADAKGKSVANVVRRSKGGEQPASSSLAKESRVRARARARERTREKMCIKQQQIEINGGYELNPNCSIPVQYMNNQLEVCKISCSGGIMHCPQGYHDAADQEDLIQDAVANKRKAKHTSIFGFQTSYDMSSSYAVDAGVENWDVNNYASQSSICAILDQHKFNNSSSNN